MTPDELRQAGVRVLNKRSSHRPRSTGGVMSDIVERLNNELGWGIGPALLCQEAASTITALREEVERLKRKAYEAEGRLALLVDRATYADSYGVPGSDFTCCLFCRGGGAPNVPFEHEDTCPIKTLEGCAQSWFDADRERDGWLDEETAARKSAETELTALRQRVVEVVGPFAEEANIYDGAPNDAAIESMFDIDQLRAARALVNEMETTNG